MPLIEGVRIAEARHVYSWGNPDENVCHVSSGDVCHVGGGRGPYRIGKEEDFSKKTEVAIDLWGEENKLKFERLLNILEFFFSGQYGGLEEHHDW